MPGGIHPPLAVVASWPRPNLQNPVKHSHVTIGVLAVFGPLTVLTVAARVYARLAIQRKSGLDDWLMLVSLVPTIALLIGVGIANETVFNRHIWDDRPSEWIDQRKLTWANEFTYVLSSGVIKVSVLLFYRRMALRAVSKTFKVVTIISIISVIAYTLGFVFAIFFSCRPLNAFWNQVDITKMEDGFQYHCYNEPAHLMAATIIAAIQDLIATSLPALLCWRLQISIRQKFALYACFGVGYLVTVITLVRAYLIYRIFNRTYDVPWETWYIWILSALEIMFGTICASIPASKVFFKHFRDEMSQSTGSSNTVVRIIRAVSPLVGRDSKSDNSLVV